MEGTRSWWIDLVENGRNQDSVSMPDLLATERSGLINPEGLRANLGELWNHRWVECEKNPQREAYS